MVVAMPDGCFGSAEAPSAVRCNRLFGSSLNCVTRATNQLPIGVPTFVEDSCIKRFLGLAKHPSAEWTATPSIKDDKTVSVAVNITAVKLDDLQESCAKNWVGLFAWTSHDVFK